MLLQSLKGGFSKTWKFRRMVLLFYLVQLFSGLLLAVPLLVAVQRFAGRTLLGRELARGLDLDVLTAFLHANRSGFLVTVVLFGLLWGLSKLLVLFLSGGAIGLFSRAENYQPGEFFRYAARFYGAFLRLALWAFPVLLVGLGAQFLLVGAKALIWGADTRESVTLWMAIVRLAVGWLGLLISGMVFDYARIHAVGTGESRMRKSIWQGVRFSFGHFPTAFGLAAILGLVGILGLVLYRLLAGLLDSPGIAAILILLLVQQVSILFRCFMRLVLWGAEVRLVQGFQSLSDRKAVE